MGSLLPLSGMAPALSAAPCDVDLDAHLWELDDILWDPFSLMAATPVEPPVGGLGGLGGQGGLPAGCGIGCCAPAAVLKPPLAPGRRPGGGCKKPGGCLVPGCTTSRELTPYERRAMLCSAHLKAGQLTYSGATLRFCQKCRRLEPLSEFDGAKRSCRAKLQAVRDKRRAAGALDPTACRPAPPAAPLPPPTRGGQAARQVNGGAVTRGWAPPGRVDSRALRSLLQAPPLQAPHPYSPGGTESAPGRADTPETSLYPALPAPHVQSPSWALALPECLSVDLKLGGQPHRVLGPATGQEGASRQHLLSALSLDLCDPELGEVEGQVLGTPYQLYGAIRPGCTLLTLDACLDGSAGVPQLLRPGASLLLDDPAAWVAQVATCHGGEVLRRIHAARVRSPARGLALRSHAPVAVLSTSPGETVVGDPGASGCVPRLRRWTVRVNGQYLQGVQASQVAGEQATRLQLPPTDVDGCACVECDDGAAFLLLLSTTPEVVAEVNATLDGAAGGLKPNDRECLSKAIWAVGNALALREPHVGGATPPARAALLAFHGAAAALRFGWPASLGECTEQLASTLAHAAPDTAPPRGALSGASLMHQAAVRGCPLLAGQLLDARSPEATGTAVEADASGCTPLHIAAAAGHGRLLLRLCVEEEGADVEEGQAAVVATVAFFTALDSSGCTPAHLAHGHAELRPLVAQLRTRVARGAAVLHAVAPSLAGDASWAVLQRLQAQLAARVHSDDALAAALVACLQQAATAEAAERVPEQATSLLVLSGLVICMYSLCIGSRRVQGMLGDEEVKQALLDNQWCPSWPTYLRIPSAMCASPRTMPLLWTSRVLLCCATLLLGLVAAFGQGRRQWRWPSLQPVRLGPLVSNVHLLLLFHIYIIDPAWLAGATYSSFGGTGLLRRPWPGAVVLWVKTGASHLASNGVYGRQPAYTVLQLARGVIPMLVRGLGSEAVPASLRWMAWARIVDRDVRCDIVNAAIALLAVMHARWTQRRRTGLARMQTKSN